MAASDGQALLLQVSADTSKALKALDALSKKLSGVADDAERSGKRSAVGLEKYFGKTDAGKALDKVFDSTRFKVLDSGVARVGLFGSALEALGPAGLIAAAGIGAAGVALEQGRKALEFADEIGDAAQRIGVGTDALQEFRYAVTQTGGSAQDADAALKNFSEVLGQVTSGTAPKAAKVFAKLGFSPEQLASYGSAEEALQAVIIKISALSDESQRQGIAAKLGLTPMIGLLRAGGDATEQLRAAAHKLGYVMDADVIAKAGDAQDKLEALNQVLKVQLATTFAELAPIILKFAEALATAAKAVASFAADPAMQRNLRLLGGYFAASAKGGIVGGTKFLFEHAGDIAETGKLQGVDWSKTVSPQRGTTVASGVKLEATPTPKKPKAGPADQTDQLDKAAQAALDNATQAAARATAQLAATIEARAEAQQAALNADRDETLHKLAEQEKEILKSKNDAHKAEQLALIGKARAEVLNQHAAETELLSRQTAAAKIERAQLQSGADAQLQADALQREEDHFNALAQLTGSTKLRAEFELEALARAQAREVIQAQAEVDRAKAELKAAEALNTDAERITRAQNQLRAAEAAQAGLPQQQADASAVFQQRLLLDAHPLLAWADAAREFNREAESAGVRALDALSTGLADAIVNAHSLGDVAKSVFRQMIADLLAASIKRDILGPLLTAGGAALGLPPIPAHAGGGRVQGPGTGTSDSILSWLSNDEYVVNARAARKHGPLLEAINSGKVDLAQLPRFADGGRVGSLPTLTAPSRVALPASPSGAPVVSQSFDLRGAVVTEQLYARMQAIGQQSAAAAVSRSVRLADRQFPQRSAALQTLGT